MHYSVQIYWTATFLDKCKDISNDLYGMTAVLSLSNYHWHFSQLQVSLFLTTAPSPILELPTTSILMYHVHITHLCHILNHIDLFFLRFHKLYLLSFCVNNFGIFDSLAARHCALSPWSYCFIVFQFILHSWLIN